MGRSRSRATWGRSTWKRSNVLAVDLNGDGRLDIAGTTGDGFEVLLGK
jgi:hypothetical protein